MFERAGLLRIVQDRLTCGTVEAVDAKDQIVLVELVELAQVAADCQTLAVIDKAMQRLGTLAAGGNRVNGKFRSGVNVTADEDIFLRGLVGDGIGNSVALLACHKRTDIQRAPVDGLTDCGDDGVDFDGLKFPGADGLAAALFIRLAQFHELDLETANPAVRAKNLDRRVEEAELHALFPGFGNFFPVGRHLVLATAVDHIGLGAEADSRAADIHRDIAATDDGTLLSDFGFIAQINLTQEVHTAEHALQFFARNIQPGALLCADGHIEALVALGTELFDCDIPADFSVHLEVDTHLLQNFDFALQRCTVQTIAGYTHDEHAARLRIAVKDGDILITHTGQVVGTAQTRGAGTDDGDLLVIGLVDGAAIQTLRDIALCALEVLFGNEFLDLVNGKRLIQRTTGAGIFTAAVADISTDRGEGIVLLDEL